MKKSFIATAAILLSLASMSVTTHAKTSENLVNRESLTTSVLEAIEAQPPLESVSHRIPNIELIALNAFEQFGQSAYKQSTAKTNIPPEHIALFTENGHLYFEGYYKDFMAQKKAICLTPIVIDTENNFTIDTQGETENFLGNKPCLPRGSKRTTIKGTRRIDGYYQISVDGINYMVDGKGQKVDDADIMSANQNYLKYKLDHDVFFADTNTKLISAILAESGVYEIAHQVGYVQSGESTIIYADTLKSNIEIRLIKNDPNTIYGVYIVSQNSDNKSQVYVFKYFDAGYNRIKLMTNRVVKYDFDEKDPSTYEKLMSEGVVYTTYTQVNGIFYKNQQRMF